MPQATITHSCCDDPSPESRQAEAILGLCARTQGNSDLYCRLVVETDAFEGWELFPQLAERHGLGPLVYTHLKAANALLPAETWRLLKGLYLRHRTANNLRGRALAEILGAFQVQGIQALALKGAALAHLLYPQPGLRPMRDLDLLVKKSDAQRSQDTLRELGYEISLDMPPEHHHLPNAKRTLEGLAVSVEVHHDIFPATRHYHSKRFEDLVGEAIPFQLNGASAFTLGYEDNLWHVYRHALGPPLLASPLRLVWVADLVSLADRFRDQIDWGKLKRCYPQVFNILPLLHFLTPWSEESIAELPFEIPPEPRGAGFDFEGWPRVGFHRGRDFDFWSMLRQTLYPSEWWLRLYYGVSGDSSCLWQLWVQHPLHLLEWVGHFAKQGLLKRPSRPDRNGIRPSAISELDLAKPGAKRDLTALPGSVSNAEDGGGDNFTPNSI